MKNNKLTLRALWKTAFRLRKDEDGSATLLACIIIMMMALVGGMGVDLMQNEMERTRLQNTLDRAILAAADLDQSLDPEGVVNDYFNKAGMSDYLNSVNVTDGLNFRSVTANASLTSDTRFMRLVGVDELVAPAVGTAQEYISNVEISLVLDISGSMSSNNKMTNLRNAAKTFVNDLLDESEDRVSISLVPYSEHVNAGRDIFLALPQKQHRHNYSYCVEFPDSDFNTTAISSSHTYDQMQHFQWWYPGYNDLSHTTCSKNDYEEIQAFSQSTTDLEWQINRLQPRVMTSIFLGVKWGAALLDPSTRGVVNSLISAGEVDGVFSGRPAAHDDDDTLKTIVVMTDGVNTESHRIKEWAYNSNSEYVHWNRYNFWYYMNRYVSWRYRSYYYERKYTGADGDAFLDDICDAAKNEGIIIWAVGFEVTTHGANVMRNCASSPAHYFDVDGVEISSAFAAIASQINQLRLSQ